MRPFSIFALSSALLSLASLSALLMHSSGASAGRQEAQAAGLEDLLKTAAGHYQEGDYLSAHREYQRASQYRMNPRQRSWLVLRTADALWRIPGEDAALTSQRRRSARRSLEALIETLDLRQGDILSQAHLALGELLSQADWEQAQSHYRQAARWNSGNGGSIP